MGFALDAFIKSFMLRLRHCVYANSRLLDIWKALCINSPLFMHHAAVIIWNDVKCGQKFCRKLQPAHKMLVDTNRSLWNEKLMGYADVSWIKWQTVQTGLNRGLFIGEAVIRQPLGFTEESSVSYHFMWEYIRPQLSRGEDIKGNVPPDVPSKIRFPW